MPKMTPLEPRKAHGNVPEAGPPPEAGSGAERHSETPPRATETPPGLTVAIGRPETTGETDPEKAVRDHWDAKQRRVAVARDLAEARQREHELQADPPAHIRMPHQQRELDRVRERVKELERELATATRAEQAARFACLTLGLEVQ